MELLIPPPSEKQRLFLTDEHRYVAYGGARGGGKSWAVRVKAVLLCLNYPGIKVMIVRKTNSELYENHIEPIRALLRCGEDSPVAKYSDTRKTITFANGSRILSVTAMRTRIWSATRARRWTCSSWTRPRSRARTRSSA